MACVAASSPSLRMRDAVRNEFGVVEREAMSTISHGRRLKCERSGSFCPITRSRLTVSCVRAVVGAIFAPLG